MLRASVHVETSNIFLKETKKNEGKSLSAQEITEIHTF